MSGMLVPIETLGAEIKARVEAGDKAFDKAEQHYISAGIQLAEAKARLSQSREMRWSAFLFSHVRLKERRVRELLALADGRTTLAEMREKTRERVAAHRERKKSEPALRNAEIPPIAASDPVYITDGATALLRAWERADDEERQEFLRKIRSDISDWYAPKDWLDDCAYELHLARGTPIPEALAKKNQYRAPQ